MSSKRIVASCAVMALVVVGGSRYAITAFPLTSAGETQAQAVQIDAGPLERRANPVTPENPVPRRISHVQPVMPAEAESVGAHGTVSLQITVDQTGRVAEARPFGMSLTTEDPRWSAGFTDTSWRNAQQMLARAGGGDPRIPQAVNALVIAATTAVRQWQYDPPFNGPISFAVVVRFGVPPPPPPAPRAPRPARPGVQQTPPSAAAQPYGDGAVRVGDGITAPTKTRDVRPIYPPIAQAARVQGVVIIEARVEADGTVGSARVLRSIPLLDQAALDAVRQWQFVPTRLNGHPVPVIMTTTVDFRIE